MYMYMFVNTNVERKAVTTTDNVPQQRLQSDCAGVKAGVYMYTYILAELVKVSM